MLAIHDSLRSLARERPLFHSEADFQHALAWQLKRDHHAAQLRLEYPSGSDSRIYLDIKFHLGKELVALELKYKTQELHESIGEEMFHLKNQRAQDVARYDYLKDVERLETLTDCDEFQCGYAILLSNDHTYWTKTRLGTVDADFRLHEGRQMKGCLHWGTKASAGTKRGREEPIRLRGTYRNRWRDYSQVIEGVGGQFHYLLHEIRGS